MTTTEHLTTGWEPGLAAGDTLVRRYLVAWAALCESLGNTTGAVTVRDPRFVLTDRRAPAGYFNAATLLAPQPAGGAEVLDEIEARTAGGTGEVHLWSAWPTPDLTARGWLLGGHPPLLARPPGPVPSRPGAAVDLRSVIDADGLVEWERTSAEGYPMPELLPATGGALAGPAILDDPRWRLRVGHDGDAAVSTGALFTDDDVAVFALGATRPEARKRGHWRAHATDRLQAAGDRWALGVFSDLSRPLAERIGFVPLLRLTLWVRPRP